SSTLMATCWLIGAVAGPLAAGLAFEALGAVATLFGIALIYVVAWVAIIGVSRRPIPAPPAGESVWESVATGVRYVAGDQVRLGGSVGGGSGVHGRVSTP